ncbi:uncharacterized protein [Penaeus vannamei]|uniref:uncharacterized protein n=1 Tax=Penaeus vannamei TaxID=6689 RepID=UPI00387FAA5D
MDFSLALMVLVASMALVSGRPSTPSEEEHKGALEKQVEALQRMKCEPKDQKFEVRSLLEPHNDLLDMNLLTNVVAIKRCDASCSYCGNAVGYEARKCQAVETRRRKFHVVYIGDDGGRKQSFFRAEEHLRCDCL